MHEAVYSALRMATGGYPTDTLIVTKDEEGNPMVSMFVLDGDMQLFRVFYDAEDGIELFLCLKPMPCPVSNSCEVVRTALGRAKTPLAALWQSDL